MRKLHWMLIASLALFLPVDGVQAQQKYPAKPIRVIVPFTPGGGIDVLARILAQKLSESFATPVVVDNRPGAAGTIGTETVVRANPDGYTMMVTSASYATNAALYKLPYDPANDVAPIALLGETAFVVTLHPSVPVKTVKELVAYDKAYPGKLHYGSSGTGGILHLAGELFNQMAATRLTHVPHKGASAALNDLLGGHVQAVFGGVPLVVSHLKANRLRGVGITSAARSGAVPDIPPVSESVPGYEVVQWYAVLGPKALPKDIVARWNGEIDRISKLPDVKQRMANEGVEPAAGSPERFRVALGRDIEKWRNVVRTANIKPEG